MERALLSLHGLTHGWLLGLSASRGRGASFFAILLTLEGVAEVLETHGWQYGWLTSRVDGDMRTEHVEEQMDLCGGAQSQRRARRQARAGCTHKSREYKTVSDAIRARSWSDVEDVERSQTGRSWVDDGNKRSGCAERPTIKECPGEAAARVSKWCACIKSETSG